MEWIDLTRDHNAKILKRVLRAGEVIYDVTVKKTEEEQKPRLGDRVKVKLTGQTDGQVFLPENVLEFNLFTGENLRALDIVITSMLKNEICEASISPHYVTDDLFNEHRDRIPRDRQLLYTVELIDWDNEFLSRRNDGGVMRRVLAKGAGYETPAVNSMVTVNLTGHFQTRDPATGDLCLTKFDQRNGVCFRLSEGTETAVVRGLEFAIYKMKPNELNRVYVQRRYALHLDFGLEQLNGQLRAVGALAQVPEQFERLIYEVQLISFQLRKQIWQMEMDERFQLCDQERARGAEFFRQGKLSLSLKCYSEILQAIGPPDGNLQVPEHRQPARKELLITAYNNMALCYLKLRMPKEALKYVDWTLAIDADNLKAIYRKGLANYDRNDFQQAIEHFNRCLELDPNNRAARNQIALAQQQIERYQNKEKQIFSRLFDALAKDEQVQSMEF